MDSQIRKAIDEKRLLEFSYGGYHRVVEPHVYGIKNQKHQLLSYQVRGESSRPQEIPHWRRFDLEEMFGVRILDESFLGSRDNSPFRQSDFDVVLAVVR